jgi:hypothetical protein
MIRHLGEDIDRYRLREAEAVLNSLVGFNFGDGHLHDKRLIAAIQQRCQFQPGELVVAWVESKPIHRSYQRYEPIDAALGVLERGRWQVRNTVATHPRLPDGPIPLTVEWTAPQQLDPADQPNSATTPTVTTG